jgi:hypothetical protein
MTNINISGKNRIYKNKNNQMKNQAVKKFDEWIFEAESQKNTPTPAGYEKSQATGIEDNIEAAKIPEGWNIFPNSESMQVSKLKTLSAGISGDKTENFNSAGVGALVMSPVSYRGKGSKLSFVVGFPFKRSEVKSKDIEIGKKYLLFSPFEGGKSSVTSPASVGDKMPTPHNFRLIPVDSNLQIGLQTLIWIIGINNAEQAKKIFSTLSKEDAIKMLKNGLDNYKGLSNVNTSASEVAKKLAEGYKNMMDSNKTVEYIFTNFASAAKKMTKEDLQKELGLKS